MEQVLTGHVDMAGIEQEVAEAKALFESLERLRNRILSGLRDVDDDSFIGVGKSTIEAGELVVRPEIAGERFKAARFALGALNPLA